MDSASLLLNRASLPNEVDSLKDIVVELAAELETLKLQLSRLRRSQFGVSSERLSGQWELFTETVSRLPLPASDTERISYERRRCAGRPRLPKDLPRLRVDYDLSADEKAQFDSLQRIGEEVSETLDYTPAKVVIIEHVRAKYRCRRNGESTIRTAAAEPSPIAKSNASAGLLAQVLVAKYADGLPLNRQERIFRRHGVELARATLCDWILGSTELLAPLLEQLRRHVLGAPVIFADDTTVDLIQGGRGSVCTARLWAYVGAGSLRDAQA